MKKSLLSVGLSFVGLVVAAKSMPEIVSAEVRKDAPTILDVVYRVKGDSPTVKVRALAFKDGERSLAKVILPKTFVDGTSTNLGDHIAVNVDHRLSWKVADDWKEDLAKCKFEVLCVDQGKLPMDLITIPKTMDTPELTVSYNVQTTQNVFNAMLWYYAAKASDIRVEKGLMYYGTNVIFDQTAPTDMAMAANYVFGKMGYAGLTGPLLQYARDATRKTLNFSTASQNAYLTKGVTGDVYVGEKAYCVIDMTKTTYTVSYLNSCPIEGWSDDYRTNKILLRRIEPGTVKLGGKKSVTLTRPYYIGVFEITQDQYKKVTGAIPSVNKGSMRPVDSVSWDTLRGKSNTYNWPTIKGVDGNSFIGKLRKKTGLSIDLPTEAQWQHACRAGTVGTNVYYNGGSSENDVKTLGRIESNRCDKKGGYTEHTKVGQYLPNAWGLYDMYGNVYEWCLDYHAELDDEPTTDWGGPEKGDERIRLGGYWKYGSDDCKPGYRGKRSSSVGNDFYGVRIVINL